MSFLLPKGMRMPKVSDAYIADKKKYIFECTSAVLKEKPLYQITMRDIIKKTGFSQGTIYRHYASLDEIYVDFINKHTANNHLEQRIDWLLRSNQGIKIILVKCFMLLGKYTEELMRSAAGKLFFEFMILYSYDPLKRDVLFPQLRFKQSLEYARSGIIKYVTTNIRKGLIRPRMPIRSIVQFVNSFIDGIALHAAYEKKESASEISEMFRILAITVNKFLEIV